MKKLVLALCTALSTNAFAGMNANQYIYNIQIMEKHDGKTKVIQDFSTISLENEPVSFVHQNDYSQKAQCNNQKKITTLSNGSKLTVELPQPNLKSGVFILLLPEVQSDEKLKIDTHFSLSNVLFKNYHENNGCSIPLYHVETTEVRLMQNINLGKHYKFPVGTKYEMAIKVEKKTQ